MPNSKRPRSTFRRRRRSQNIRYRAPRFLNRVKPKGWLPPSLRHRVDTTLSVVKKMCRYVPVSGLVMELVKFDSQKLQNPEVSG
ncbi:RRXRR domain-containing protein, partial [Sutterella sp.]|uniref:RRXRR domain-containing protein n=1 Tax=Sutterella sp. TaxID=1981025 RepID=UPI003FD750B1